MSRGVSIIGTGIGVARCALALAEMGIEVNIITPAPSLGINDLPGQTGNFSGELLPYWPLLLRVASHPLITLHTNSQVKTAAGKPGKYAIKTVRSPRYVREELCTACGRCENECSVKIYSQLDGHKVVHSAIHAPLLDTRATPSAYYIEKTGIAPCRVNCPLGINVQGFIALLAKGKLDKALSLITESAPMPGVLGRLCTHPCELNCSRSTVDEPLFVQALHRYAADNAPGGINYNRKAPAGSRKEKIAIVGSGPAGLAAGWELARRGYTPTIFESHAVVGGMLATGIPRFRLPREVREREVEAIRALGVDMKTGVTVGKDVTYHDLIDRGYKAFFLAIGAQQNNKLNIPGEDLDGVSESISLLFALNLKVGAGVGSNVVVIGGGNSAVDSARAAKRRSKGDVRILCVTSEMTAVKEEVEEALKEGVQIDYLTSVAEILGDADNRAKGIRCQRVKKAVIEPDGRLTIDLIPDSDFVIEADHVVISIGQKPNIQGLSIKGLEIKSSSAAKVDPLTLETNIPGIFAGGDSATGSNNVVEAIGAGLRAAESIDRFLRGRDLRKGRILEKPEPAKVDVSKRKASTHKRSHMPVISFFKRKGTYEETNLGLTEELAVREAGRCLNCALCCECQECEQVCELGAVFHSDSVREVEIESESVINFVSNGIRKLNQTGVYNVDMKKSSLQDKLARASAVALKVATQIKANEESQAGEEKAVASKEKLRMLPGEMGNTGVMLCQCGGSINSAVDFNRVSKELLRISGVSVVGEIAQACTREGADLIAAYVAEGKLGRLVLAACRCCNLDQICYSCTDRRVMCHQNLLSGVLPDTSLEFVNIREQCAWIHANNPEGAFKKAVELISAGVARVAALPAITSSLYPIDNNVLVFATGPTGLSSARDLAALGYKTEVIVEIAGKKTGKTRDVDDNADVSKLLKQLKDAGVRVHSLPQTLTLSGYPGNYEVNFKSGLKSSYIKAGAIILELSIAGKNKPTVFNDLLKGSLIERILIRKGYPTSRSFDTRDYSFRMTNGIFIIPYHKAVKSEQQVQTGAVTAAQVAAYLNQGQIRPRTSAVAVNEKLCRGCGDCVNICPYIEMQTDAAGQSRAYIHPALCYGCGACISSCPTGAITQPFQSETSMVSAMEALLGKVK